MKKIEYPEDLLKTVDTFSELRAIRSLIGKYMMMKKLMYDVKRDENVTSRLPDDLITGVRDRIAELNERRDFLASKEDDIRHRLVDSLKDLLVSKILHMERFDNAWKLDEYVAVENVSWYGPVDIRITGKAYQLDCNYSLTRRDYTDTFPLWMDSPEALNHNGPHYDNLLPLIAEMDDEDDVKQHLLGETFNF